MKKILAITLTLVLLLSVIPMGLFSITASAATEGYYTYTVSNGEAKITGVNTPISGDVTIPSTLGGYPVTSIGSSAFSGCTSLTSITIPDSVTSIGRSAFYNCISLTSVTLPNRITQITSSAFEGCKSLTSIFIPDGVVGISGMAFRGCNKITSVRIPQSLKSVHMEAFSSCTAVTDVYYGGSYCDRVEILTINSGNLPLIEAVWHYAIENDIIYEYNETKLSAVVVGCNDRVTNLVIPSTVTKNGKTYTVTNICERAFSMHQELKSIVIADTVVSIGNYAFSESPKLAKVTIGSGMTTIGRSAFEFCSKLKEVLYKGSKADKSKISIHKDGNSYLTSATWYYNICEGKKTHVYDNTCDATCNICGLTRTITHTYTNGCDKDCNVCGKTRTTSHKYSNNCDTSCNVCKATRTAPHSYKTTTTKATLTKNGSVVKTCSGCKKKVTTATIYYPKTFSLSKTSYTYNGKVQTPTVTVKDSKGKVIDAKYYTISYSSGCKSPGTYKVTVKFKGNYSGTKTLSYKINPISISKCKVSISGTSYLYTGKTIKPTVKVLSAGGSTLKNGTHYTVTYSSGCKNPGTYKVTVKMKGTYTGSKTFTYKISKVDISKCKVTLSGTSYTYNGKVIKPSVKIVTPNGTTLKKDTHYTVTYSSGCKSPGTYKVTVKMKGYYTGSKTYTYKINKIDISKCKVSISGTNYIYDGKVKTPTITVKSAGGSTLKKDTHYTVSYAAGRKDVGAYTVKVTMKGNYTGSKTFTVTINPQGTEITNLFGISDSIDVTISKKDTHITGYEIEYSTNADFSNSQTKIIAGCETTKVTISGLSQNTAYYVRVRTYTLVGDVKFYSGWSDVKSATTEGFGIDNNDGWILGWH